MKSFFVAIALLFMLGSCAVPTKIAYFQNTPSEQTHELTQAKPITLQKGDKLSIIVSSKKPELATLFNLPAFSFRAGTDDPQYINQEISAYTVGGDGNIDFPILGKIAVEGKTRDEVIDTLQEQLKATGMISDPVVTLEFRNLFISVLGEVNRPGRYEINRDVTTILDAISQAGDLSISGLRESVTVMRRVGNKQTIYKVSLLDMSKLMESPVYVLQQNDVVYVEPNNMRKRQSTLNGNNWASASFWLSLASALSTVALLFIR